MRLDDTDRGQTEMQFDFGTIRTGRRLFTFRRLPEGFNARALSFPYSN